MRPTRHALVALACLAASHAPLAAQGRASAPDRWRVDAGWADALTWRSIGPANMGGRVTSLAINPQDPCEYWVGTASGGVLHTTNNGVDYTHQFDREETVSVGHLAVAASDPTIVWVGTGEANPRNSVSYGNGVYKSTDSGATWTHMGLDEGFQTGRIAVHPADTDVVYVGVLGRLYGPNEERGLYKTTDGGTTWELVLFVDDETGVIDVDMHPTDPDTLIVATYERERDGFDTNDPAKKWGDGSALWRTTDGGASWDRLTEGLPTVTLGRIGVDWYQADPNVVYAVVESERIAMLPPDSAYMGMNGEDADVGARLTRVTEDGPTDDAGLEADDVIIAVDGERVLDYDQLVRIIRSHVAGDAVQVEFVRGGESSTVELTFGERPEDSPAFSSGLGGQRHNVSDEEQGTDAFQTGGLFRSDDGGTSWARVNSVNPRPMYYSQVRVDPSDDQHVYVLGTSLYRSSDGGKTFTSDGARGGVHVDHHALWIDPRDGRHMILGNDGGIYVTWNRMDDWDHHNHMALGQFYHVAVDSTPLYRVYGGLQDNGTWGGPSVKRGSTGPINIDWVSIGGGDGFVCQIDEEDPDQIYYESQNGGLGARNLRTGERWSLRPSAPRGVRYRWNWRTPFVLSEFNSRIYYVAGSHVFRSLERGRRLQRISDEITHSDRGSATALEESPRDANVLFVGSDDGALWRTTDGGATWTDLIGALPGEGEEAPRRVAAVALPNDGEPKPLAELLPKRLWVASIDASRHDGERVYLCLDGHRSDLDDPFLFVSEDGGDTWSSISANLPRGSTRVLREDLENEDLLYCGTEFGAWVSADRGQSWAQLGDLPTVAVHELAQSPAVPEMVAATHGRSLWVLDLTVLRQLSEEVADADLHVFEPRDVMTLASVPSRGSSGLRRFVGQNPSRGMTAWYHVGRRPSELTAHIAGPDGSVVRELEAERDRGLHRLGWDLRGAGSGGGGFRGRGAPVSAGTYKLVVTADGETFEHAFEVTRDPERPDATTWAEAEYWEELNAHLFEEDEEGGEADSDL